MHTRAYLLPMVRRVNSCITEAKHGNIMTTTETETPVTTPAITFDDLGLDSTILRVLNDLSFTVPTEVQAQAIPLMLKGHDVLVQSQTGTGKTAAFGLPMIQALDPKSRKTQCIVLAPTRELAIQVCEALATFCKQHRGIFVTPIFGGSDYTQQIKDLKRGSQIVVGTPGRVMDHMRKGTLHLDSITHLILDEADEMLRMGFIDDVEWILSHTPEKKQMALFSATMPSVIKKISQKYLTAPKEIHVKHKAMTVDRIKQYYAVVKDSDRVDAIQRIIEMNLYDGIIIFARTKIDTQDISDRLAKAGLKSEALNGDLAQATRKRCIEKMKAGKIDIIVATDVAARGIDIERVSCVINMDIPFDHETYVHRIGRTGRAGRDGDAILLVSPKQQRMLKSLERTTNSPITKLALPSAKDLNVKRIELFQQKTIGLIEKLDLTAYKTMLLEFIEANELDLMDVAATLAHLAQGNQSLLNKRNDKDINSEFFGGGGSFNAGADKRRSRFGRDDKISFGDRGERSSRPGKSGGASFERRSGGNAGRSNDSSVETGMARYRLNIGRNDGVKPGNIVGAIANEAKLSSRAIGRVTINPKFSLIDLPNDLPASTLKTLERGQILGKPILLSKEV